MRVTRSIAQLARTADTAWHLAAQTMSNIVSSTRYNRRHSYTTSPGWTLLRGFVDTCRYWLGMGLDPRTFHAIDGDGGGRRRADLNRAQRRQRRVLADLRRRHVTMLLHALGDTADEVEATLTRHWQRAAQGDVIIPLIEDFLTDRLRWRDRLAHHEIDIYPWASNISGVWVAIPAPVRRYLDRSHEHRTRLEEGYTGHPRRGVRPVPEAEAA